MKNTNLTNNDILRQKAENKIANRKSKSNLNLSECDYLKLNHELLVHQIELEIQNEELILEKEKTDYIAEKYIELYNFAPLGYFTLTKTGEIIELNRFGSQMLDKEHALLVKSFFGFFVVSEDKSILNLFIEKIFESKITETCMVSMSLNENSIKHVLLTGNISKNGEYCLIAAIDISDRLLMEKESNELHQFNSYFIGRELRMVELKKEINELLLKGGFDIKYPV